MNLCTSLAGPFPKIKNLLLLHAVKATFGKEKLLEVSLKEFKGMERIPGTIERKIYEFIETIGIQATIEFRKWDSNEHVMTSCGTIKDGVIIISPKILDEIRKVGLLKKHRFLIAHEVGHLFVGDSLKGVDDTFNILHLRIVAYSVTLCAFAYFSDFSVGGFIQGHVAGCLAAYLSEICYTNFTQKARERKADEFAMRLSREIAEGGRTCMEEQIKANILAHKAAYHFSINTADGNYRFNYTHPDLTERLRAIEEYLKET